MHMTNGASFNLTSKKHGNPNMDNVSNGDGHSSYQNQVFIGSTAASDATSGLNIKNAKNVLSGPL